MKLKNMFVFKQTALKKLLHRLASSNTALNLVASTWGPTTREKQFSFAISSGNNFRGNVSPGQILREKMFSG